MKPKTVDEATARRLIISGEAGYWGLCANPPIEHDETIIVLVGGHFYVVPAEYFQVEAIGPCGVGPDGRLKGLHQITINEEALPELVALIRQEVGRYGK